MGRLTIASAVLVFVLSGTGAAADPCPACVVDVTVTRTPGPPAHDTAVFVAESGGRYRLTIELPGKGSPVWVTLNGESLVTPVTHPAGGVVVLDDLALPASNTMTAALAGIPGRVLRIRVERLGPPPLAACPPWLGVTEPLFHAAIAPLDDLVAIQPLGALGPTSHTLPTHHTYWGNRTIVDAAGNPAMTDPVAVLAPGAVRVVGLEANPAEDDFKVLLRPCLEIQLYIDHVTSLSPVLQAAYESARRYVHPGGTIALLDLPLEPGTPIGIGGGTPFDEDGRPIGSIAVNVGLIDLRRPERPFVNPDRYRLPDDLSAVLPPGISLEDVQLLVRDFPPRRLHQFCPLDYFADALAEPYRELLGSPDGGVRRVIEPRCGDFVHDVAGTLAGAWFEDKPANGFGPDFSNDMDESRLVAFAPSHVDPTQATLSLGHGVEAPSGAPLDWQIPAGTYTFGAPQPTGLANRAFRDVVPGATFCYENLFPQFGSSVLEGVVLVEVGVAELWIMRTASPACADVPPTLRVSTSLSARRYVR